VTVHHSHEWGVAAGTSLPDRSIVKTERAALPVGRVAPEGAPRARPLRHRAVCRSGLVFLYAIGLTEVKG